MLEVVDIDVPPATTDQSGKIKAIGKDSVHRICSGQVVISLAVAVKELVENAIDAGATLVEIRLRNYGLDELEVIDNGSGVAESDLEAMTAKYHTSKIREFVDLLGVETFGFRGEALSSLCELSDVVIMTRHRNAIAGTKIELNHEGGIKTRSTCARSTGTTVTLSNLFGTLPVRRRDFERNVKKEFTKMSQMLQAYCLVATGVRIMCSNSTAKAGKLVVMQTHGAKTVLANISAIFGSKCLSDIVPLKSPVEVQKEELNETLIDSLLAIAGDSIEIKKEDIQNLNAKQFQLEGYVSSCKHGTGRSSKDRQYFYINNRPCDHKNISKVVNEVYHRYNSSQYPFVYLNVSTSRENVDVNLAPDKRQLLINKEKVLLLLIRKALLDTYGSTPSTYKLQNCTVASLINTTSTASATTQSEEEDDDDSIPKSSSQKFAAVLSQWKLTGDTVGAAATTTTKRKCSDEIQARTLKLKKIQDYLSRESAALPSTKTYSSISDSESEDNVERDETAYETQKDMDTCSSDSYTVQRIDCKVSSPAGVSPKLSFIDIKSENLLQETPPSSQEFTEQKDPDCNDTFTDSQIPSTLPAFELDESDSKSEETFSSNFCAEISTSLQAIELEMQAEEEFRKTRLERTKLERLRFKSAISPSQNESAEAELQTEISKESFAQMDVLGQFNLGFIIVKLGPDLFIVDQHASDEKYNFETLQRTTTLQYQPLTVPQQLELTAVSEMVLLNHQDVFEKNGFKFEINETAPSTSKVRLLGKPFSKNWEFGKSDIDELIFMLQDAPEGTICRPSRIRAMFASRACRKSVMIGQALKKATMTRLIRHMGEIEQPWNCPHGRPTMRHLINTAMLLDDKGNEDSG